MSNDAMVIGKERNNALGVCGVNLSAGPGAPLPKGVR